MWKKSQTKSLSRSKRRRAKSLSRSERRRAALRVIVDHRRDYEDFLERLIGGVSATLRQTTQVRLLPFPQTV